LIKKRRTLIVSNTSISTRETVLCTSILLKSKYARKAKEQNSTIRNKYRKIFKSVIGKRYTNFIVSMERAIPRRITNTFSTLVHFVLNI